MASLNEFKLMGNLAADPEMRYLPNGSPVCTFPLAVNSRRKDHEGKPVEHVDFFRITAKFKLADVCVKYLKSGRPVFVSGKLESWKNEGKFGIHFMADDVQFLGAAKGSDAGQGAGTGGAGSTAAKPDGWTPDLKQWRDEFSGKSPN